MPLDPKRTVAELKELRALTEDENGAQRVAFTPTWAKARAWLRKKSRESMAPKFTTTLLEISGRDLAVNAFDKLADNAMAWIV